MREYEHSEAKTSLHFFKEIRFFFTVVRLVKFACFEKKKKNGDFRKQMALTRK